MFVDLAGRRSESWLLIWYWMQIAHRNLEIDFDSFFKLDPSDRCNVADDRRSWTHNLWTEGTSSRANEANDWAGLGGEFMCIKKFEIGVELPDRDAIEMRAHTASFVQGIPYLEYYQHSHDN